MKHWKVLTATLLVSVMLCGCGKSGDVIVTVNDKPISAGEFNKNFEKRANSPELKRLGIDINAENNRPYYLVIKNQVIDEMIVMALIDEEVAKKKISISDEEFKKEYDRLVESIGSEDQIKENLKQNDMSLATFKKEFRKELTYRKLIDQIAPVSISDDDAKAFYNKNAEKFNLPERVRASHILISANKDEIRSVFENSKEAKGKSSAEIDTLVNTEMANRLEKAKAILAEVKKDPTQFANIAKEKSDDRASAKQGGDLGIFTANQMVEPFSKAAFSLKPNTVSDIVVTPYGYHIIMVQDKMAAGKESFEKAKDHIKKMLEMEQRSKQVEEYLDNLKKTAKIEYKDESFKPESINEEMKKFSVAAQSAGAPTAPEGKK